METVTLNTNTIPDELFKDCTGLKSIDLSANTIERLPNGLFNGCTNLTEVKLPSTLTVIGYQAFEATGLTTFTVPASVKEIYYSAFSNCSNLESVTFEEGSQLTSIGSYTFDGCKKLTKMVFPESMTNMGKMALAHGGSLEYVDARGVKTANLSRTSQESWFYDIPATAMVYVSAQSTNSADDPVANTVCGDVCALLKVDAEKAVNYLYDFTATKVTMSGRSFSASTKGTLFLPFSIGKDAAAGLGKFYAFSQLDDDGETVHFSEVSAPEAATAYLFAPATDMSELVAENVEVKATASAANADGDGLKGTFEELVIKDGLDQIYFWSTAGEFSQATESLTVGPTRAYLQLSSAGGSRLLADFGGGQTGIATVDQNGELRVSTVYDLQGRQVKHPVRGSIYVVNGKKVIL